MGVCGPNPHLSMLPSGKCQPGRRTELLLAAIKSGAFTVSGNYIKSVSPRLHPRKGEENTFLKVALDGVAKRLRPGVALEKGSRGERAVVSAEGKLPPSFLPQAKEFD